jgi:hypothetical protein
MIDGGLTTAWITAAQSKKFLDERPVAIAGTSSVPSADSVPRCSCVRIGLT